jgi:hypothetical protein
MDVLQIGILKHSTSILFVCEANIRAGSVDVSPARAAFKIIFATHPSNQLSKPGLEAKR